MFFFVLFCPSDTKAAQLPGFSMAQRFSILLLSSFFPNAIRSDQLSTGTPRPGVLHGLLVEVATKNGHAFFGDKGLLFKFIRARGKKV